MGGPNETQDVNTSGQKEETSKAEPETFTQKDMEEATRKSSSDALAELGRFKKINADLIKSSQVLQERQERKDREADEAELEANRDKPDVLSVIKERTARRLAENELSLVRQDLSEKEERLKEVEKKEGESTKERNAREVATRLGVDPKILGRLAQLTDGSIGEIEKEAKGLPKVAEAKDPLKVDSGKTMGGGEKTDEQKLKDRYPTM